jgi:hypothetical protein
VIIIPVSFAKKKNKSKAGEVTVFLPVGKGNSTRPSTPAVRIIMNLWSFCLNPFSSDSKI